MEYTLYCDESSSKGPKYSDFFGGCLIKSTDLNPVVDALEAKKQELNLLGEIKWTKVTAQYLDRYIEMMDLFFDFIREGKVKVRIMFRSNHDEPSIPTENRDHDKYFKLYYQFIKNAFGLKFMPAPEGEVFVRVYLDQLPDTTTKCEEFKDFIRRMPNINGFREAEGALRIRKEDVADVCSHDHVLLQCTDIVLGAMFFRLNDLHLEKPDGSRTRGKRTIAKEKLYKHIHARIEEMLPYFNIGISTGHRNCEYPSWELPYSHWKFVPN